MPVCCGSTPARFRLCRQRTELRPRGHDYIGRTYIGHNYCLWQAASGTETQMRDVMIAPPFATSRDDAMLRAIMDRLDVLAGKATIQRCRFFLNLSEHAGGERRGPVSI